MCRNGEIRRRRQRRRGWGSCVSITAFPTTLSEPLTNSGSQLANRVRNFRTGKALSSNPASAAIARVAATVDQNPLQGRSGEVDWGAVRVEQGAGDVPGLAGDDFDRFVVLGHSKLIERCGEH
jgi:hypothetical protein